MILKIFVDEHGSTCCRFHFLLFPFFTSSCEWDLHWVFRTYLECVWEKIWEEKGVSWEDLGSLGFFSLSRKAYRSVNAIEKKKNSPEEETFLYVSYFLIKPFKNGY